MTEHEQIALQKIRESYASSKRVVEQIMTNHRRVSAMLNMMRASAVLGVAKPEDSALIIGYLDSAISHMETMIGVISVMHGVASLVNSIMSEHEEFPVIELPEKWDGADG